MRFFRAVAVPGIGWPERVKQAELVQRVLDDMTEEEGQEIMRRAAKRIVDDLSRAIVLSEPPRS